MIFITTWWGTDCMVTRLLRAKVLAWVLLLSWGFFLDPKGALLQWEILIHHVILGLSSFIPVSFFGFFFFSLSTNIPMGFHGFFFLSLNAYIPLSLFGFFFFVFLYPPTYSPASLVPLHSGLESGQGILGACGSRLLLFQFCLFFFHLDLEGSQGILGVYGSRPLFFQLLGCLFCSADMLLKLCCLLAVEL